MKVIKTDDLIPVTDQDRELLEGAGIDLVERHCPDEDELIANCRDAAGLLTLREPLTSRVIGALESCRVITRFGVGLDTVDVQAATRRSITVTNVPDANYQEVALHALAMLLNLTRRLTILDAHLRSGNSDGVDLLHGIQRPQAQVVGIVGWGRTGTRLAELCNAVGFTVIATDSFVPDGVILSGGARPTDLDSLLCQADVVSLHLPLTTETRHLICATTLAVMKRGAFLVNTARGGLVDEGALADSIKSGHLGGAALDVFENEPPGPDNPLVGLSGVLSTPHSAHYSEQSLAEVTHKAFADVARVLTGLPARYPVNSQTLNMPSTSSPTTPKNQ